MRRSHGERVDLPTGIIGGLVLDVQLRGLAFAPYNTFMQWIAWHRRMVGVLALICLRSYSATLPELPDVNSAKFLPVIRTQIERATADAKTHPRDPRAIG